ncbi:glycosyltransferase [Pontiella sp.]|uniref:glycosyltransferase n=1 Tax=Pontiella sp. TaxID=2837462 RepID=UPI00356B0633
MDFDIRDVEPVVSVSLITFNHAAYIRECLDSLLGQDTDFPYEICLGEDESSDGTREICIDYAKKHPDRIRLILRSQSEPGREKFRSQGVYNFIETCRDCRGKYQAICDGDDAWIDPLKLQKQFDIMQNDPSISLVHSDFDIYAEATGQRVRNSIKTRGASQSVVPDSAKFRCQIILRDYEVVSSSTFVKTADLLDIFEKNMDLFRVLPMGDIPVWCELLNYGTFYFIDESLCLYRLLPESDSNSNSARKRFEFINGASNLGIIFGSKYDLPMDVLRSEKIKSCNRYALLSGDRAEIDKLYADSRFRFSFPEQVIYHAGRLRPIRPLSKFFFELRYNINNHRLSA